jgi:hypothetical protein
VSLGARISGHSAVAFAGRRLRSRDKIDLFYLVLGTLCVLAAGGSFGAAWFGLAVLLLFLA